MNRFSFPFKWAALLGLLWLVAAPRNQAEPFVPASDQDILERLRTLPFDPVTREVRQMRAALAADPTNLLQATRLAWRYVGLSRAEGDPRHLGHAQSVLAPWWDAPQPPVSALVLRATIRQSQHDFLDALEDLDTAVKLAPDNPQAWLTRAAILTVLGRYDEARRSCFPLARLAPGLVVLTAAANVASLNGQAGRACDSLRTALDREPSANAEQQLWALTLLAETSARLGQSLAAERYFRRAIDLDERDVYLLGAFSDFLLDERRPSEVLALLKDETRVDALLLRLTLAQAVTSTSAQVVGTYKGMLRTRFETSRLRGDRVHRREEARFTLQLLQQPQEALRLACANWQVQREPADARVLLEAAVALQDRAAAAPVLEFVRTNRLEDVRLDRLISQLPATLIP